MIRSPRTRFAVGFITGSAIALSLNLLPYWQSYGPYGFDGYEVIGFPLIFRRFGGFSPTYEFRFDLLSVDIAVGVVIAVVVGLVSMKLLHRFGRRSGRGFPVVANSDGWPTPRPLFARTPPTAPGR